MEALVQPGMVSDLPSDTRNTDEDVSAQAVKDWVSGQTLKRTAA